MPPPSWSLKWHPSPRLPSLQPNSCLDPSHPCTPLPSGKVRAAYLCTPFPVAALCFLVLSLQPCLLSLGSLHMLFPAACLFWKAPPTTLGWGSCRSQPTVQPFSPTSREGHRGTHLQTKPSGTSSQVAGERQGWPGHQSCWAQVGPVKLSGQVQWKSFQVTRQVPPFKQGLGCGRVRAGVS